MMLKDLFLNFLGQNNKEKEKKYGSTDALEYVYLDNNGKYFKGRYKGTVQFGKVFRFQYEVQGGILLIDKPATKVHGEKGFTDKLTTYNGKNQVQRINTTTGLYIK